MLMWIYQVPQVNQSKCCAYLGTRVSLVLRLNAVRWPPKLVGITNSDNSRSTGKHLDKFTQESGVETCSEKGNNVECKCPERHYKNDRIA